jgi:hypothetical protein
MEIEMFDLSEITEERRQRRLDEAAAERLRQPSSLRHTFAALLRRTADRLEPVTLLPRSTH